MMHLPEGAEERRRVQGSLLAEGTAEHVARAMAKTARAGALVTHPVFFAKPAYVDARLGKTDASCDCFITAKDCTKRSIFGHFWQR